MKSWISGGVQLLSLTQWWCDRVSYCQVEPDLLLKSNICLISILYFSSLIWIYVGQVLPDNNWFRRKLSWFGTVHRTVPYGMHLNPLKLGRVEIRFEGFAWKAEFRVGFSFCIDLCRAKPDIHNQIYTCHTFIDLLLKLL